LEGCLGWPFLEKIFPTAMRTTFAQNEMRCVFAVKGFAARLNEGMALELATM